jgi:hypothetical protein
VKKRIIYQLVACIFIAVFINVRDIQSQISFNWSSSYKYLKGSQASGLSGSWINTGFNDAAWSSGTAPFHYGDGTGGTLLSDMQYTYSTVYLRSSFNAQQIENIKLLTFNIIFDDGFVIWINGKEVFGRNAPADRSNTSFSTELNEWDAPAEITIDSGMVDLVNGSNTLAIQVFNYSLESSDIYFDLQITAVPSVPEVQDTLGVQFSHPAGFYSSAFSLTLTSPDPSATLVYTIDGSNPQTSGTAKRAGTTASISVNPASTTGRARTPGFLVRASIEKAGYTPSKPQTRSYIFLDQVKTQSADPGGGWPTTNVNGQYIDLEMDPDVVNDSRYSGQIVNSLKAIPTISLVTDIENLFDPSVGIYVNADGHGLEWERFSSVELINPDGTQGFQTNAGLRIRGGWSRHDEYPKHAFRLFFRETYGDAKLDYPLFGEEGVDKFDKIDLRCEQNYSWANWSGEHNTFVREVFSRDTQRDMGQPYTRSRYYHLYLNGMYWGIFQTQERSEARFAADYLGDSSEDYDVIKVNTEDYSYRIEATDGVMDSWQQIYNLCQAGFTNNAAYYSLEGKDANGNPVAGSEILVDIDNLIDYMLSIFYTGNFDAPTSSFMGNAGPNNFYAIQNRNDKSKGFIFFSHDAEHALMVDPISPGVGLNEDRVNITMRVSDFSKFHPQWLHFKLSSNPEYRIRFADRAALFMTGNGALTEGKCLERFNNRVAEVEGAVIAESARWGDAKTGYALTKDDTWLPEIETVQDGFFPFRTAIVLNQLKKANLYSSLDAPRVKVSGTEVLDPEINIGNSAFVTIENPNSKGVVYYTTNGSDPRETGGIVSPHAIRLDVGYGLTLDHPALMKARIYDNGAWSALRQVSFYASNNELSNLKVTELHYHPQDIINTPDTVSGKFYEFIEFKNTGLTAIDLSGLVLDSAVYYEFPAGTLLPPGQFFVVVTKPGYFYEKYGKVASGNCKDYFNNAGEYVLLKNTQGDPVLSFLYDDEIPFPEETDGEGYSLTSREKDPTGSLNDWRYWMASTVVDGSPFADDPSMVDTQPIAIQPGDGFMVFPNPCTRYLSVRSMMEEVSAEAYLSVFSMTGALVYETRFDDQTIVDLQSILPASGLYMINIRSNEIIQTTKIIYTP